MPLYRTCRPQSRRRATAAVELALLLPFLAFAFVSAVDFGRVFYYSLTVEQCARNGAFFGSLDPQHAMNTTGIRAAAKKDASNLNVNQLTITPVTDGRNSPTVITATYIEVTASYSFTTVTQYPGIPSTLTISRKVRMKVIPILPP